MADKSLNPPIQTIEITNFGGRLTRIVNGDLNSGLANFANSFGYDPFSKPGNLTWLEQAVNIDPNGTTITDLVLATVSNSENGSLFIYALGSTGNLYKIQPNTVANANVDSVVGISSVKSGAQSYNYGASMQLFNYRATTSPAAASTLGRIYVAGDQQIIAINTDGSAQASIAGSTNGYVENVYRPTAQFQGKLVFGNGNNIGVIDSTNIVTSPINNPASIYGQLQPGLPSNTYTTDLDVSPDGNYLIISTSTSLNEQPTSFGNASSGSLQQENTAGGNLYMWNGSDLGATASNNIGNFGIISLQSYLQENLMFINDMFGASLNNGTTKLLTLPGSKSPFPNATAVNGNFLTWITPEIVGGNKIQASLFYYGNLDGENQPGLWRVLAYFPGTLGGNMAQTPSQTIVNGYGIGLNSTASSVLTLGYGKHYLSTYERTSGGANNYRYLKFFITPTGTGSPQSGIYQTQTQLFSRKVAIKQVRVYTEPTVSGNAFNVFFIDSGGNFIKSGNTITNLSYTFTAGTDVTQLQGSLDRIDFNPVINDLYAFGLYIENIGGVNMTIKKIEIDYTQSGK